MIMSLVKNILTQWQETEEENRIRDQSMQKPLKQVIKTKGKIDWLINEKPPNPVGTKEENRSADGASYYVFAFLVPSAGNSRPPTLSFCAKEPSHCGSRPSELEPLWVELSWIKLSRVNWSQVNHHWLSHWRFNANKRQDHFGRRKNDGLINKKPFNPVELRKKTDVENFKFI